MRLVIQTELQDINQFHRAPSFQNIISAAHFAKAEYDDVIEVCRIALDVGRSHGAERHHIAK